ncbi:MAG: hypothetical protein KC469_11205 [Flavobacteriaceae bacterium]|nr:hypothetical protein [Flavobacteriaceae bacterium]
MAINNLKKQLLLSIAVGLFLCSTSNIIAQSYTTVEGDSINPRAYVTMGYYFPRINTSLRVDTALGIGTEIGLEDLGLDEEKSVFKLDGAIRISPKSQLALTYTSINRNSKALLEKDIKVGDTTFLEGSGVGLKFNIDYFAATWRYSFFNQKNWNAGLSVGARAVSIKTGFKALVNTDSDQFIYEKSPSFIAPAILFGVHGSAYLTPKLLARYSLEYFYLSIDGIDINVIESNFSVQYFIFKQFGLGLAYSTNDYQVNDIPLGDFNGKVDFNFGGMNLFLSARF